MNSNDNEKAPAGATNARPGNIGDLLAVALLSAIVLGTLAVAIARSRHAPHPSPQSTAPTKSDAEQWLDAVSAGREKNALELAETIAPSNPPELPDADYLTLCLEENISTAPLTSPFNHLDYLRWRDALTAKNMARSLRDDNGRIPPEAIPKFVFEKYEIAPTGKKTAATIAETAADKRISPEEATRLMAAIARQAGLRAWAVAMFDEKRAPVAKLIEIRGNDGAVATADPASKTVWKDKTAENADIGKKSPGARGTAPLVAVRLLPAEMMDYKPTEQRLARRLAKLLPKNKIPAFADDPRAALNAFVAETKSKAPHPPPLSYWHFPFQSLKSSPEFPKQWRTRERNRRERKLKPPKNDK